VRDYAVSEADNPCQALRPARTRTVNVSHWSSSHSHLGTGVATLSLANRCAEPGIGPPRPAHQGV